MIGLFQHDLGGGERAEGQGHDVPNALIEAHVRHPACEDVKVVVGADGRRSAVPRQVEADMGEPR